MLHTSTFAIIALAGLAAAQTTTDAPTFETKVVTLTFDLDFGTTTDEAKTALVADVDGILSALFGTDDIVTELSEGSIIATSVVSDPTVQDPDVTVITLSSGVVAMSVAVAGEGVEDDEGMGMGMGELAIDGTNGDRLDEQDPGSSSKGSGKGGSGGDPADRMDGVNTGKGKKGTKTQSGTKGSMSAGAASAVSRSSLAALSGGLVLVAGVGLIAARRARRAGGFKLIKDTMEYTETQVTDPRTPLLEVASQR